MHTAKALLGLLLAGCTGGGAELIVERGPVAVADVWAAAPDDARILDGSGDAVMGERHLQLKARAEAYARAYNQALAAWRGSQGDSAGP